MRNWNRFFKNDSNKQARFQYIATFAQVVPLSENEQLVVTCRNSIITNPPSLPISEFLSPCDHEEADTRMILHMHQILETAFSVTLRTVDTDVLVLAIAAAANHEFKHIFVDFGVGENRKTLKCHSIRNRPECY